MSAYSSAKKIVERLHEKGHLAYFAGGWVRDYLLGRPSSDIDIATDAPPEEILSLFKKTIPVGISFGVVVVVLDNRQFEVSTFRKDLDYCDGRHPCSVEKSVPEEDAKRRDFTINGMFYDPFKEKVIDFVGGKEDLKRRVIRTIGDPKERFREDRLRMIRAVRFAYRLGFQIDEETKSAIKDAASTLFPAVSIERVWQEFTKMAGHCNFDKAVAALHKLNLLQAVFPCLKDVNLEEIEKRVSSFAAFPENCPPILFLMELFPDASFQELIEICQYLRVSKKEQKIIALTSSLRECVEKKRVCKDANWARFYANPLCDLCLHVIFARFPEEKKRRFLSEYKKRQQRLIKHIDRIKSNAPLVTSMDLKKEGIAPSQAMGKLLFEAESVSVNEDIHDKKNLIEILKRSEFWPKP